MLARTAQATVGHALDDLCLVYIDTLHHVNSRRAQVYAGSHEEARSWLRSPSRPAIPTRHPDQG